MLIAQRLHRLILPARPIDRLHLALHKGLQPLLQQTQCAPHTLVVALCHKNLLLIAIDVPPHPRPPHRPPPPMSSRRPRSSIPHPRPPPTGHPHPCPAAHGHPS